MPPGKPETGTKPSFKSLIQEMEFTDKTPKYQHCVKFLKTTSPKNKNKNTAIDKLTSSTESANDKTEIPFVKGNNETGKLRRRKKDEQTHEDAEHEKNMENDNNNEANTKNRTEN